MVCAHDVPHVRRLLPVWKKYELSKEHFQRLVETEAWNRNQSGTWSTWMDIKTMLNHVFFLLFEKVYIVEGSKKSRMALPGKS